jgi:mannose-6-phosphate isomerase-like protein (cupin superfamily)
MRLCLCLLAAALAAGARAEIRGVLKSAEIDSMLSHAAADVPIHERPHYSIWLIARSGKAGSLESHSNTDELLFVRQGSAVISLGSGAKTGGTKRLEAAAGDVIKIPAGAPHQVDPGSSRFEALALRILAASASVKPREGIRPPARQMPDLLRKSEIDATFADFTSNQPIHSAPNFTMNYVIYTGHSGPWEAHAGCVDIYFLNIGSATAQIGGVIANAREDVPGEPRGDGASGASIYTVGPGDLVVIPRNTPHHMDPGAGKLGYVLVKVWVD